MRIVLIGRSAMASFILRANFAERQALDDPCDALVTGAETERRNGPMKWVAMEAVGWVSFTDSRLIEWSSLLDIASLLHEAPSLHN